MLTVDVRGAASAGTRHTGAANDDVVLEASGISLPLARWSLDLVNDLARVTDGAITLLAGGLSLLAIRATIPGEVPSHWAASALILAGVAVGLLSRFHSYRPHCYYHLDEALIRAVVALPVAAAGWLLLAWTFRVHLKPELTWLGGWVGCSLLLLIPARLILRVALDKGLRTGVLDRTIAIIGATEQAARLIDELENQDGRAGTSIIGIFDDRSADRRPERIGDVEVCGSVKDLCRRASHDPVDAIIIALPWQRAIQIFEMVEQVQWLSADVMVVLGPDSFRPRTVALERAGDVAMLQVMGRPLPGSRGLAKIAEDYVVAIIGLGVTLPIMLLAALAIRLEGRGPVLFRQHRVGFRGEIFRIYKLRTMRVDPTDAGTVGVSPRDPRITRVGRVLRRFSIDEMPQLLNVLRGEMSIVGPRPHVAGMLVGETEYSAAVRRYAARHQIKPGITGWAQVNGVRGSISDVEKARRRVDLDLFYIDHWSIWFDLRIIFRTLVHEMVDRDAC